MTRSWVAARARVASMSLIEYDPPERFVVGTVGPPGSRTFFIQASDAQRRTQVAVEKIHVTVLAERLEQLLDTLGGPAGAVAAAVSAADNAPLDTPITQEYRVTALALAWDEEQQRVTIECHDHDPDQIPSAEVERSTAVNTLRVVLSPQQARAFARRCTTVAAAGRPACPFCAGPLDPEGHICPRANGYRR